MRISDWSSDVCSSDLRLKIGGNAGMAGRTTGMAKSEAVATESIDGTAARDAPLIDLHGPALKKLIRRAQKRGVITYDELNQALPQRQRSSEQMEAVTAALPQMRVKLRGNDKCE